MTYYEKAKAILTSKEKFHIELGLNRIATVLKIFDNPQDKIKTIHVAGTNGKGSTCAILNEILVQNGYKTGLFTSPHITKYTERIKVNNKEIPDEAFYNLIIDIENKCKETNTYLTEFEILTVAGFLWFQRQNVDIAIIEVGLGGRLDATNVIQKPVLSVITSISLDHTDRLGNTIDKIAGEKAGIIKPNVPCVVSAENAGFSAIKGIAEEKKSQLISDNCSITTFQKDNKNYALIDGKNYEFNLIGKYQEQNLALAVNSVKELKQKGFQFNEKAFSKALKTVHHKARFEIFENLIIDGAHNPDGAKMLRETLNNLYPEKSVAFIYASLKTKDFKSVLKTLVTPKDELYLLEFNHSNAVSKNKIENLFNKNLKTLRTASEIKTLVKQLKKAETPVVLTGSLYAIGQVYDDITKNYPTG